MRSGLRPGVRRKAPGRSLEWSLVAAAALFPLTLAGLFFALAGRRPPAHASGLPGHEAPTQDLKSQQYGPGHYKPARQEAAWEALGRLPPEQLAGWREYAAARGCSLDDADYAQIFRDLAPFREGGGVDEAMLRRLSAALPGTLLVGLGGGAPVRFAGTSSGDAEKKFPAHAAFWKDLLGELAAHLPPIKLLLNAYDEARSWVAPLPAEVEELMRNGSLTEEQVWHWRACDSVSPELAGMKRRHGAFASRLQFRSRRGLLPVFSAFKAPGCFADILIPGPQNNPAAVNAAATRSACPLSNTTFESKRPIAVWRGSSTGATYHATLPPEEWQQYHRQRLVALSKLHPEQLDAGFTAYIQCAPNQCDEMERRYGRLPPMDLATLFDGFRFQMVVDGNGAPTRLLPTLCSGALTLLASILDEWWYFRARPFQHYLPVKPDYSDLLAAVDWARQHTAEAAAIAAAASRLVNTRLRRDDALCYTYRLLLEYAAIYRSEPQTAEEAAAGDAEADGAARLQDDGGGSGGGTSGRRAGVGGRYSRGMTVGELLVKPPPSPPAGQGFEW
ncbi:hypothetical protein ABPG75_003324 [Micractinium tetrahymenae]